MNDAQRMKTLDAILDLSAVAEYFDERADVVDGDYGVPEPNEEMRLGMIVADAIIAIADLKELQA